MKTLKTLGETVRDIHAVPFTKSKTRSILNERDQEILDAVCGVLEGMKGEEGARLDTFREGYKAGYNQALTDAQTVLKRTY